MDEYLEDNLRIVPLFEVDVVEVVMPYVSGKESEMEEKLTKPDPEAVLELCQTQEALEKEMVV